MLIAAILALTPPEAAPLDLHLSCVGQGSQSKPDFATLQHRDSNGNFSSATVQSQYVQGFDDQVRIDITGDTGRIRVPQAMLPPVRGGKDGWFPLRDIRATQDEIVAVATINLFNKVKLRLDRLAGTVSFSVLHGQFNGRCSAYDPAVTRRAF